MTGQRVRKLVELGPAGWAELLRAQGALIAAQLRVWTRPRGRLIACGTPPSPEPGACDHDGERVAERLALAVERAARYGVFRPLCLVRALALQRMLEARGIRSSRVRIGVRLRDGRFAAHAWVEYGGRVLGDTSEHVGMFSELADAQMAGSR